MLAGKDWKDFQSFLASNLLAQFFSFSRQKTIQISYMALKKDSGNLAVRHFRPPVSNPIMWQFEKQNVPPKLFFLTLFREFLMFFQLSTSFHYSTAKQFH
jgi:hypothetical protein